MIWLYTMFINLGMHKFQSINQTAMEYFNNDIPTTIKGVPSWVNRSSLIINGQLKKIWTTILKNFNIPINRKFPSIAGKIYFCNVT